MMCSGFAGLGYQVIWMQQSALWLGNEAAAVLAVVTAFFGGLALGASLFGPRIERSTRPVRWYAGCEFVIAAWSLLVASQLSDFGAMAVQLTGAASAPLWQWAVTFCATFVLLLPATAAMGATLPAMERVTAQLRSDGRSIASLYAANTLGAVAGVLAIAFWLIPAIGLTRTAMCCVAANVACAAASLWIFPPRAAVVPARPGSTGDVRRQRVAMLRLGMTGLLGIGFEVLVVRVLSQVTEDTVYTFAMLLAVYLGGSAAGAAGYQKWLVPGAASSAVDSQRLRDRLLCALAAACLVSITALWSAEVLRMAVLQWLGHSMTAALGAETTLALVAFAPPTIVMGALFSHLSGEARAAGVSYGSALGSNTLGAAAAALIFGVLLLPALGSKIALLLVSGGYLALASRRAWREASIWVPACALLLLVLWAPPLTFVDLPDGGHVVSYREGITAAVSVVEDADGVARLRINNRQQEGSSATQRVDSRQAWLPLLLHPAPKHVLFLGLGTGVTASSAAQDPTLQVDAVELLPEVIAASSYFRDRSQADAAPDRLHVIAADARRYVKTSRLHYDVIIADNFHPARSGSGALYTVEHFNAIRERLEAEGIFCQWLPLHQLDLMTLRSIVRSFLQAYPQGIALLASSSLATPVIGLVGHRTSELLAPQAVREHLAHVQLPQTLAQIGIEDEFALLGSVVAGPSALRRFAGDAIVNTDDLPIVAYRAPHLTYSPDSLPRDRLVELQHQLFVAPAEVFVSPLDDVWAGRLSAYWTARDRFIESGRNVRASSDVQEMLAQVQEPLLSVLRISPDFRPAYDPLLRMATVLMQTDPRHAQALLTQLTHLQPARPEAPQALHRFETGITKASP